jgi:outer membrane immunogenic protein
MGKRLGLLGSAALLQIAVTTGAGAADMPVKVPPTVVPFATWTGFYVGADVGGGFSQKKFLNNFPTPDLALDAAPNPSGWVGGLQAGYNYQINSLLLGVEGGFTWIGARSTFHCFTFGAQSCTADPEWLATITPRIGAIFGPALFYVKGGAAWIRDTYTDISSVAAHAGGVFSAPGDLFTAHNIRPGWTAGGGIEYLFMPNWSVRVEYDYAGFRDQSVGFTDGGSGYFTELIKQNLQIATVGVDYHFGAAAAAPAPIVVKASRDDKDEEDEPGDKVLPFTGVDVSKWSVDTWAGALIAPWKDLDTSGPRVWIYGGGGVYKYPGQGTIFRGAYEEADALFGYGFEGNNYSINALIGVNANNQMVTPFDPDNKVQGTEGGVKVRGDAYTNPTPQTMTYGEAEYSTAFQTYYLSQKVGYDITNSKEIFFGPIATLFGDERYHQWRVGAHISNIKFGKIQVDLSAGYADDSVVGTGAFGKIEVSTTF